MKWSSYRIEEEDATFYGSKQIQLLKTETIKIEAKFLKLDKEEQQFHFNYFRQLF